MRCFPAFTSSEFLPTSTLPSPTPFPCIVLMEPFFKCQVIYCLFILFNWCSLQRLLETVSTDGFLGRIIRLETSHFIEDEDRGWGWWCWFSVIAREIIVYGLSIAEKSRQKPMREDISETNLRKQYVTFIDNISPSFKIQNMSCY